MKGLVRQCIVSQLNKSKGYICAFFPAMPYFVSLAYFDAWPQLVATIMSPFFDGCMQLAE